MTDDKYLKEIQEAINYIEDNICEPITVGDVSSRGSFSSWEFQRIFRAFVGDSIGNYIRGRRLTMAALRLQNQKSQRIIDVAIEYQFGSQEAFARAFKKQFHITPGDWRKKQSFSLTSAKPMLNSRRLNHFAFHISKKPELKILPQRKLIGLPMMIDSTLGKDIEIFDSLKNHWTHFKDAQKDIKHTIKNKSYGLIFGSSSDMSNENLFYAPAVEVTTINAVPAQMEVYDLNEQQYAVFEIKGNKGSCQMIADYIYGIWLPQVDFVRGDGFDFELFNHELYNRSIDESILYYHLPIKNK